MECRFTLTGTEPVELNLAKAHLNISHTADDSYIEMLIASAREDAENFTGRSFVAKTIEYFDMEIPEEVALPYPDHESIETLTVNGVATDYTKTGLRQFRVFVTGTPSGAADSGLYVKYKALGVCPESVKRAILMIVDERYRNRGNTFEGSVSQLSENAYALLSQYAL